MPDQDRSRQTAGLNLAGKVAIVTGGARGFGLAISKSLSAHGAAVAIVDLSSDDAEGATAAMPGNDASAWTLDVSDRTAVKNTFDAIHQRHGRVDILVNNAGIIATGPVLDSDLSEWERLSAVNISGTLYCAHAAARLMREQDGGRIINISSISAIKGNGIIGNVLYGATKGAICTLTQGLAGELGRYGIAVNAILPGLADTEMTHTHLHGARFEAALARIPLGQLIGPDDVAGMVVFLASDMASRVSGVLIPVDGASVLA